MRKSSLIWILSGCFVLLFNGCDSTEEIQAPMIEDAYLSLSPVYNVREINAPREKAGYALSFHTKINDDQLKENQLFQVRIRVHEPDLHQVIGQQEIVFPSQNEFQAFVSNAGMTIDSLPYMTHLSPSKLQRYMERDQIELEVFHKDEIVAKQSVTRLNIQEPYFGESEHWWISTDFLREFGAADGADFFTVSLIYKGNIEEVKQFERAVLTQGTTMSIQGITVVDREIDSNHVEIAFLIPEHSEFTAKEAASKGGVNMLISWETAESRRVQEEINITTQDLSAANRE